MILNSSDTVAMVRKDMWRWIESSEDSSPNIYSSPKSIAVVRIGQPAVNYSRKINLVST